MGSFSLPRLAIGMVATLLCVGVLGWKLWSLRGDERRACTQLGSNEKHVVKPIKDYVFRTPDGRSQKLSSFAGKTLVINFWSTWCSTCKEEKKSFVPVANRYADDSDVQFLSVVSGQGWESFPNMVEDFSIPVLIDPPANDESLGTIAKELGMTAVPETFVINKRGEVVYHYISARNWHLPYVERCLRSLT